LYVVSETAITKLWDNDWDTFIEESSNYNHKIISIEEDGYEDVYNITVDEFHNYGIITNINAKTNKKGHPKLSGIYIGNCGEAPLSPYSVCCLGSLNLPNFITGNINTNWVKLERAIGLAVRFLDNVLDVNKYSLKQNDIKAHESRRIGLGVLGLANYLFSKKLRYGSPESLIEIEKLFRFIRDCVYQELIKLSVEKGSFPKFEPVQYVKSSFIRKLPVSLRLDIKNKGVRCVTAINQAPCGCLIKESIVQTEIGNKKLDDIFKENDINLENEIENTNKWIIPKKEIKVKTINDFKKITKLYINGINKTKIIKLKNGTVLEGTNNHKVLILNNNGNGVWKRLDQLTKTDKIIKMINNNEEYIDLKNIDYELLDIEFIENSENFTVDIEVEDDHYYILDNGIISHNTISLIADKISGIEPLIAKVYRRDDRVGSRIYVNPIYEDILKTEGTTPDWFVDSFDLKPEDHLEVQSAVQKYVDGAISKTVNLPMKTTSYDLSKLLLEYAKDLKGVTVYRDGSREGQILNPLTEAETLEYLKNNKSDIHNDLSEEDVQCASGTCEI